MAQTRGPSTPLALLDAPAAWRWLFASRAALGRQRARIDALNVYPVPDGDTGTNLYLTLHTAIERYVAAAPPGGLDPRSRVRFSSAAAAVALEALLAARGNSGVILSQLLRGIAEVVGEDPVADDVGLTTVGLARALGRAQELARRGVSRPVEGTILTVASAAAAAAEAVAAQGGHLAAVTRATLEAAREALARTPEQLPVLRRAGVVDAGGAGLVVILRALHETVAPGDPKDESTDVAEPIGSKGFRRETGTGEEVPAYEVMFTMSGLTDADATRLRADLERIGDSVLVAGDSALTTVHVHTDDAGPAIEAALVVGKPERIRVSWLGSEPHPTAAGVGRADTPSTRAPADPAEDPGRTASGVLACAGGPRLAEVLQMGGARTVLSAPGRRATTGDLLGLRRDMNAEAVIILTNQDDTVLAAESAAHLAAQEGLPTLVVPTKTTVAGLAALSLFDPSEDAQTLATRMQQAARACRAGMLCRAERPAETAAGRCSAGDVLAYMGEEAVAIGSDPDVLADDLLDRLIGPAAELVTLVSGLPCHDADGVDLIDRVSARLEAARPGLEVCLIRGDALHYDLLVGVE